MKNRTDRLQKPLNSGKKQIILNLKYSVVEKNK